MRLLASKPVIVASLAVAAVGLSGAGGWLQQSSAAEPKAVIKFVPSPGVTTIIIKRTQIVLPPPSARTVSPSAGSTIVVPGSPAPQRQPSSEPNSPAASSPAPPPATSTPTPRCVHPPRHKCRHRPHTPLISVSAGVQLWLLP